MDSNNIKSVNETGSKSSAEYGIFHLTAGNTFSYTTGDKAAIVVYAIIVLAGGTATVSGKQVAKIDTTKDKTILKDISGLALTEGVYELNLRAVDISVAGGDCILYFGS